MHTPGANLTFSKKDLDLKSLFACRFLLYQDLCGPPGSTARICDLAGNAATGNGFFGGLQFEPGTWRAYGGEAFAPEANQATREQQIVIAQRVLAAQGWLAWPVCSQRPGLR